MVRGFSHLIPVTKKLDKTFLMSHIHNRGMQSKMITTVYKFAEYEYGGSFYPVVTTTLSTPTFRNQNTI